MTKTTPTMEDYIEVIYSLVKNKGYARSADIAEKLEVYPSTVTKMLKKLDVEGYIVYEKYRGIALTENGRKMGEYALTRHELLEDFLRIIEEKELDKTAISIDIRKKIITKHNGEIKWQTKNT